jgi:hypothetical protein
MQEPQPKPFRRLGSRIADGVVLLIAIASVVAVAEMAVRPFYPASPRRLDPQVSFRPSPRFGWEMVPDERAHSFDVPAPINRRGHRGPEVSYARTDSLAPRWVLLGGGTAFGTAVHDSAHFAGIAAGAFAAAGGAAPSLVNLACEGYNLDQSARAFAAEGVFHAPDAVILVVEPEDLAAAEPFDSTGGAARVAGALARLNRAADVPKGVVGRWLGASRLWQMIADRRRSLAGIERRLPRNEPAGAGVRALDVLLGRSTPALDAAWLRVASDLDRLAAAVAPARSRVYVVVLPLPAQLRRAYARARWQSRLEELCAERGFVVVDPLPALREERRRSVRHYLPRLPFLGPAGHRVLGEQLAAEMDTPLAHRGAWRQPGAEVE